MAAWDTRVRDIFGRQFAERRPSRSFAIRLVFAALLILIAVLTNRQFLGWGLFVVFAILFVPLGRARSFLLSFVPYAAVWFVFTALRSLADETILAKTMNTAVPRLERWLFGGQLPTVILQEHLLHLNHLSWYDYVCTFTHWSYFIVPHAVAIWAWHKNLPLFRHYFSAMTLLLAVGLCIYFLIPTNPPWMAPEAINSPAAAPVYRVMEAVGKQLGGGLYQASYRVIGESNPIAAMPSIHMAITFLLFFPLRTAGRRWAILSLLYSALMAFSLVYLGEHYVLDVSVGILIAIYGWVAAGTWLGRATPIMVRRFTTAQEAPPVAEPGRAPAPAHPR
jgi:membrane-associated phospholipid phosphatase